MTKPRVFGSRLWMVPRLIVSSEPGTTMSSCAEADCGNIGRAAPSAAPPNNFNATRRFDRNMKFPLSAASRRYVAQPAHAMHTLFGAQKPAGRGFLWRRRYIPSVAIVSPQHRRHCKNLATLQSGCHDGPVVYSRVGSEVRQLAAAIRNTGER